MERLHFIQISVETSPDCLASSCRMVHFEPEFNLCKKIMEKFLILEIMYNVLGWCVYQNGGCAILLSYDPYYECSALSPYVLGMHIPWESLSYRKTTFIFWQVFLFQLWWYWYICFANGVCQLKRWCLFFANTVSMSGRWTLPISVFTVKDVLNRLYWIGNISSKTTGHQHGYRMYIEWWVFLSSSIKCLWL